MELYIRGEQTINTLLRVTILSNVVGKELSDKGTAHKGLKVMKKRLVQGRRGCKRKERVQRRWNGNMLGVLE